MQHKIITLISTLLISSALWACPAEEGNEKTDTQTQTEARHENTGEKKTVDPNAPVGEPPDQKTMLLASFTGCFDMNEDNDERVSRTTLKISIAPGNELKEYEKYESLEVGRDTPDVMEESSILQVKELEETMLVFMRFHEGAEEGIRGVYSWVDGKFYVTDGRGQRRGPFNPC